MRQGAHLDEVNMRRTSGSAVIGDVHVYIRNALGSKVSEQSTPRERPISVRS
jgi:hypothetical protein